MTEQSDYQMAREKLTADILSYMSVVKPRDYPPIGIAQEIVDIFLKFTYKDGSPMIGVIARDQILPPIATISGDEFSRKQVDWTMEAMIKVGFRRIAKEV